MIEIFLGSIGLLLIIEGLLYAVFPNRMKSLINKMCSLVSKKRSEIKQNLSYLKIENDNMKLYKKILSHFL